jgi:hypothetical protein
VSRVKIGDLKPEARNLDAKEMKKLFGGFSRSDIVMPTLAPTDIPEGAITARKASDLNLQTDTLTCYPGLG